MMTSLLLQLDEEGSGGTIEIHLCTGPGAGSRRNYRFLFIEATAFHQSISPFLANMAQLPRDICILSIYSAKCRTSVYYSFVASDQHGVSGIGIGRNGLGLWVS